MIGYHTADVEARLKSIKRQIEMIETAIRQESEAFVSMYREKQLLIEHLRQTLQEQLDKEAEIIQSRR